jgi:hypothetical protein
VNAQKVFLRQAFERLKRAAAEDLGLRWEFTIDTPVYYSLEQLKTYAENMNAARFVLNTQNYAFSRLPYRTLPPQEQERLLLTRRMEFNPASAEGEVPHATYYAMLLGMVNMLETRMNDRRYDFLLRPFEQARRNADLAPHFNPELPLAQLSRSIGWVIRQMLGQLDRRKNLTIVDLSGLPFDVVDTTVAVLTRALFDFNFWSPVETRQPVLLVYEEAHNYLPRKALEGRKTFARNAVEKVAKEGRKYGVSAMIVSQRPSEISETILSQCNSMVLMRMNNPDDQEYAARVVSDQFRSLISLLPSLKPGEGFVIGDAVLMPMRTLVDLPPKEPQSANMDFFRLWAQGGSAERNVDHIVERWWRQERADGARRRAANEFNGERVLGPMPIPPLSATSGLPTLITPTGTPSGFVAEPSEATMAEIYSGDDDDSRQGGDGGGDASDAAAPPQDTTNGSAGPDAKAGGNVLTAAQRKLAELAAMLTTRPQDK